MQLSDLKYLELLLQTDPKLLPKSMPPLSKCPPPSLTPNFLHRSYFPRVNAPWLYLGMPSVSFWLSSVVLVNTNKITIALFAGHRQFKVFVAHTTSLSWVIYHHWECKLLWCSSVSTQAPSIVHVQWSCCSLPKSSWSHTLHKKMGEEACTTPSEYSSNTSSPLLPQSS